MEFGEVGEHVFYVVEQGHKAPLSLQAFTLDFLKVMCYLGVHLKSEVCLK